AFSGCGIDKAGTGYRLIAQVDRVAGPTATSTPIDVSVGPPVALAFPVAPTSAYVPHPFDLTVAIADAGGNAVASAAGTITVDIDPQTIEVVTLTCAGGP